MEVATCLLTKKRTSIMLIRSVRTSKLVLDKGLEVNTYRSNNSTEYDEWWVGMISENGEKGSWKYARTTDTQ